MKNVNLTVHVENENHEIEQENPWVYNYWAMGGKTSIQGYVTLKEARWDARANGQKVVDRNGNTVLDYRD